MKASRCLKSPKSRLVKLKLGQWVNSEIEWVKIGKSQEDDDALGLGMIVCLISVINSIYVISWALLNLYVIYWTLLNSSDDLIFCDDILNCRVNIMIRLKLWMYITKPNASHCHSIWRGYIKKRFSSFNSALHLQLLKKSIIATGYNLKLVTYATD